jgi:hypothetical protein
VANDIARILSSFSDWLADNEGATPLNPWRDATAAEQRLAWAAWYNRKRRAFLGHTMSRETAHLEISRARCWRSPKTDHLCALKIDQGWNREFGLPAQPV